MGMGTPILRTIEQCARAHVPIPVHCQHCGHHVYLNAAKLQFALIGLGVKPSFYELRRHLRCSKCKTKGAAFIGNMERG